MIYTLKKPTLSEFVRVAIVNKRLRANKPASISIEGESGAGKSILSLLIAFYMKQIYHSNCSIANHIVYTPTDFKKVSNHVFFSNECTLPAIFVQETVSFTPAWLSPFAKNNPANKIYSMLVLSREVRPCAFFLCEQQFSDVYRRIRLRMNFLFNIVRYVGSEGKSFPPILRIYEKVREEGDKIVFATPIVYVNKIRLNNFYFVIPELKGELLNKFKQMDYSFKADQIKIISDALTDVVKPKKKRGRPRKNPLPDQK